MSEQGIPSGALGMYPESKHLPNLNPGGCGVGSTSRIPQKQLRKRGADCKHGFESRWEAILWVDSCGCSQPVGYEHRGLRPTTANTARGNKSTTPPGSKAFSRSGRAANQNVTTYAMLVRGRIAHSPTRLRRRASVKCSDRNPPSVTRQSPVSSNTACSSRRYHSRRADTDAVAYTDSIRVRGLGARRRISLRTPSLSFIVPQVFVRQNAKSKDATIGMAVASPVMKYRGRSPARRCAAAM